jgi:hypothetical protein
MSKNAAESAALPQRRFDLRRQLEPLALGQAVQSQLSTPAQSILASVPVCEVFSDPDRQNACCNAEDGDQVRLWFQMKKKLCEHGLLRVC